MHHALGAVLIFGVLAAALTTAAMALAWWLEPGRRTIRALTRILGAPPEVAPRGGSRWCGASATPASSTT